MSNSNNTRMSYREQTDYDTPQTTGEFQTMRLASEGMKQDTQTTESNEIRADRNVSDVIRTNVSAGGDMPIELSGGTYDDLFSALYGVADFSADVSVAAANANVAVTVTGSVHKFVLSAGTWVNTPTVNSIITVSGMTAKKNGKQYKVSASTPSEITVYGTPLEVEAEGDDVTITQMGQCVNSAPSNPRYFTMEKSFLDVGRHSIFESSTVGSNSIAVAVNSIVTGSFSFAARRQNPITTSATGSSYAAAPTGPIANSIDNITSVAEGVDRIGITNFSMNTEAGLRPRPEVASLGAVSMGLGTFRVTGTLQAYFTSETLMNKYLNFDKSSLMLGITFSDGFQYVIDLPTVKYTDGQVLAGGRDQDTIAEMNYTAYLDATEGITARLARKTIV